MVNERRCALDFSWWTNRGWLIDVSLEKRFGKAANYNNQLCELIDRIQAVVFWDCRPNTPTSLLESFISTLSESDWFCCSLTLSRVSSLNRHASFALVGTGVTLADVYLPTRKSDKKHSVEERETELVSKKQQDMKWFSASLVPRERNGLFNDRQSLLPSVSGALISVVVAVVSSVCFFSFGTAELVGSLGHLQRSSSGTPFNACSICFPQPFHVGRSHLLHSVFVHMLHCFLTVVSTTKTERRVITVRHTRGVLHTVIYQVHKRPWENRPLLSSPQKLARRLNAEGKLKRKKEYSRNDDCTFLARSASLVMIRTDLQLCQYQRLSQIRRWQLHAGSNHFCCDGRCITGRQLSGAIVVICLISLTSLLWLIFELPILIQEGHSAIIPVVGILLLLYTYSERSETSTRISDTDLLSTSLFLPIYVHWSGYYSTAFCDWAFYHCSWIETTPNATGSFE